ncbi:MAG: putative dehydrogenase [Spirochaetes bacterium]|nr:MAG: putative dehydrogenase [Spirochaetota bacterium]
MEKTRFGIYGYGKVAELHAKALAASNAATLVSVCGRDQEKASRFAGRWGIPARNSPAEMAGQDSADAIIVTTPHPLHAAHAIESLQAGLHVLVEKPMALAVKDADAMIDEAASRHLTLGVISQRRWYPSTRRLGWRDETYYRSDPWRGSWTGEGGGVIVNQAPHQLDLLAWFLGPVKSVYGSWANVNHPYIEVDDSAVATVHFASGALGSILISNSQKPGIYAKVHIHGSSGASAGVQTDGGAMFIAGMSGVLEPPFNDLWTIPGQESLLDQWKREDAEYFSKIDPTWHFFGLQIEEFTMALIEGRRHAVTGEDGRETVKLMEGIYRSQAKRGLVEY